MRLPSCGFVKLQGKVSTCIKSYANVRDYYDDYYSEERPRAPGGLSFSPYFLCKFLQLPSTFPGDSEEKEPLGVTCLLLPATLFGPSSG